MKNRTNKRLIVFMGICIALPLFAQEKPITLDEALQTVYLNNNSYRVSVEKVKESGFQVREAWGQLWPSLSSDVSYTRQWAESGLGAMSDGQYNISIVKGQIALNPGAFYNTLQASRKGYIIAENDVRRVKQDLTIQTIKLYYQLILARESIILFGESVKALEENFRVVSVGYNRGTFSRLDFLRARVALSNEKIKLINAENSYLTLKATMNIHLGREINEELEVDPSLIYNGSEENPLFSQSPEAESKMIAEMVSEAAKNRPELIQIRLKKQIEDHSASAAASVYLWPSFFINGTYGMSKSIPADSGTAVQPIPMVVPDDDRNAEIYKYHIMQELASYMSGSFTPTGWNESWNITFGATYKWGALMPYDPGHAKADQYKSKTKQTDYQLEDFIRSVRLDVQMGYLKLKSAGNSILSQKGNVEAAEESVKVAMVQFRSGIIDNSKLLEANVQLSTAKTLYVQALHDYKSAMAELNRAIGKDFFKIN